MVMQAAADFLVGGSNPGAKRVCASRMVAVLIVCCSISVILVWSSAVFSLTSSSIGLFSVCTVGVGMCWRGLSMVSRNLYALGCVCGGGGMYSRPVVMPHAGSSQGVFGACGYPGLSSPSESPAEVWCAISLWSSGDEWLWRSSSVPESWPGVVAACESVFGGGGVGRPLWMMAGVRFGRFRQYPHKDVSPFRSGVGPGLGSTFPSAVGSDIHWPTCG